MYKLKPLKAIYNYLFAVGTPVYLIQNAVFFATGNIESLPYTLTWDAFIIALYLLGRLFYPVKYKIDKEGVIVYDGERLVLKLKREQISKIYIQKERWGGFFKCLFGLINSFTIYPHCTSISFCFSESEVCRQRICSIQRKRLMTSLDFKNELCEFNELFTYRECMKICKILGIEPIFVE